MARITLTLADDGQGGVNVTTSNDTPEPEPARWTPAQRAFYAASAGIGLVPAQDLVVDGRPIAEPKDPQ